MPVYFFQGLETRNIKIGFTSGSISARLNGIQSSDRLECLATVEGNERTIQTMFKHHWLHGEWFYAGRDLMDYIRALQPIHLLQSIQSPWTRHSGNKGKKKSENRILLDDGKVVLYEP